MKVRWTLFDMTPLKTEHLKSNIYAYKMEILMTSAKFLERMDSSLLVKFLGTASKQSKMIFDLVKNQKEFTKENIDEIINYNVIEPVENTPGTVIFDLFIHSAFFETQEAIRNPTREMRSHIKMAGRKLMRKEIQHDPITEQKFISAIEKEIHKWYTPEFYGEVLEDDGKELHVKNKPA